MEFVYLFLYRAVSGAQNGLGYMKSGKRAIATLLMIIFAMGLMSYAIARPGPVALRLFAALCGGLGIASAIMVDKSFTNKSAGGIYDIHFWESITTAAITAGMVLAGGNLLLVAASVYPGLVVHKGFVNLGGGLSWWDNQTDDDTGKTFTIPMLGIAVPRSSTRARILLASTSLLLAAATVMAGWHLSLY